MGFSLPHMLLLAVVAALLLGGGRFSALMGDVAKGVKSFKAGVLDDATDPELPSSRTAHPAHDDCADRGQN